jgi:predicted dehydrogenase
MVRIGIIGVGFMGYSHFEGARKLKGGKVTAIATRDPKKLAGDWTSIQGNFGPRAGHVDVSKLKTYSDYHELLADPDIDLVDICLPTNMHEKVTLEALKAGKQVMVEKPIAIDLGSARKMVRFAEKEERTLMVGHVLPFFPEFQHLYQTARSGRMGKIISARFHRVIAPPSWSDNISDYKKLGGWGIDLHIHDNHFIGLLCGVPQKVFSQGMMEDGLVNHVHTQYVYADQPDLSVSCVSGGVAPKHLQFSHGFEVLFENGALLYSAGTFGGEWIVDRPLTEFNGNRKPKTPKLKGGTEWCSAFTAELQSAVESVKSGEKPEILSGTLALDALKICHAEAKSIQSGRLAPIR